MVYKITKGIKNVERKPVTVEKRLDLEYFQTACTQQTSCLPILQPSVLTSFSANKHVIIGELTYNKRTAVYTVLCCIVVATSSKDH